MSKQPQLNTVEAEISDRINNLHLKHFKQRSAEVSFLMEQVLQDTMIRYAVDINQKVKLKQDSQDNHYPADMVSSLKTISELYFKVKDGNTFLHSNVSNRIDFEIDLKKHLKS
jgi:hypothetical protein